MKVAEVMSSGVRIVRRDSSISEAARIMAEADVGALPVIEHERLIGMITDRDIAVRAVANDKPCSARVDEIMSPELLYCFDDQEVAEAAEIMGELKVRRLPVLDRAKNLVGILSLDDVAQTENAAAAGQTLADIAAGRRTARRSAARSGS